jgi:hypothetical protein
VWRWGRYCWHRFFGYALNQRQQTTKTNRFMKVSSTLGGLAGAAALTLLNEGVKKVDTNAPRLDLLGQNALAKFMKGNDMLSKTAQQFFPMAGDLISNSLFFGMARGNSAGATLVRGALLGLGAGVGAVVLPEPLGLEAKHTNKSNETKLMTIAWYVIGGLVAAAVINTLDSYKKPKSDELAETAISKGKQVAKDVAKQVTHAV